LSLAACGEIRTQVNTWARIGRERIASVSLGELPNHEPAITNPE
jgi:hypothetical protein